MRRLILLSLLILAACAPTATPLAPTAPAVESATVSPPATEPAVLPESVSPAWMEDVTEFPSPESYEWKIVASGFTRPLDIQSAGDGSGRLFIIEQPGLIRILHNDQLRQAPFLDITDRVNDNGNEQGLLGLAFHPHFADNGFFYVNFTREDGTTVIARFTASGDTADPNSEVRLLEVEQPFPNHNGGGLAFGPDGFLYIALGDGGSGGDPQGNGQNLEKLLGKILRVDVNGGELYAIPADNPFGNEVYFYGLRNPWRFSFDSKTGDLWIGDVGQGQWEEINHVPAGSGGGINFGWNRYEGMHDYTSGDQPDNYQPPNFEYSHSDGCSVTGGYVYRGGMPEWQGVYFYGDYCTGKVWGALRGPDGTLVSSLLFGTGVQITSFGVDESGEVYLADQNGSILRLNIK